MIHASLIVRQMKKDGTGKTWKLKPSPEVKAFGSSRLAELISISSEVSGIEGTFEFRNEKWWYISLDKELSTHSKDSPAAICIEREVHIQKTDYELVLTPIISPYDVTDSLELGTLNFATPKVGKSYQMFLIKRDDEVLENAVLPFGKSFVPKMIEPKKAILPTETAVWKKEMLGEYELLQRTIVLENPKDFQKLDWSHAVDKDTRKGMAVLLLLSIAALLISLFSPKVVQDYSSTSIPKAATNVVIQKNPKDKKKKETQPKPKEIAKIPPKPIEQVKQLAPEKPAAPRSVAAADKSITKSLTQGRISQLISKVSAQAGKSVNIVLGTGVKAGSGPSGKALSSLGKVEGAGRDWNNDAKGSSINVSTVGTGGGQNVSNMGRLNAGKTGTGGVGLIEDESEVSGGLDREIIAQYIKTQLGQILYCYERQLSAHPDLFGKVSVHFAISGTGKVETQQIQDSTLKNSTVESCILQKISTWKFPAPQGGTTVLVTYPFLFKSTN